MATLIFNSQIFIPSFHFYSTCSKLESLREREKRMQVKKKKRSNITPLSHSPTPLSHPFYYPCPLPLSGYYAADNQAAGWGGVGWGWVVGGQQPPSLLSRPSHSPLSPSPLSHTLSLPHPVKMPPDLKLADCRGRGGCPSGAPPYSPLGGQLQGMKKEK